MDFIKSEAKNIIIFIVLLVGIFFSYKYFFAGSSSNETITVTGASGSAGEAVGDDILPVLLAIKNIRLDKNFFNDSSFDSLTNFSVELTPEEAGRDNPFMAVMQAQPVVKSNITIKAFSNH
jgi:hypothetical protein